MLRFLLPSALAVALLTGSAETADFNGARRGLSSCGQTAGVYEQWVIGFLSGIGYEGIGQGDDTLAGVDANGVWTWVDNYCRAHPLDQIVTAAKAFDRVAPPIPERQNTN
jgi:hypothetical protein